MFMIGGLSVVASRHDEQHAAYGRLAEDVRDTIGAF